MSDDTEQFVPKQQPDSDSMNSDRAQRILKVTPQHLAEFLNEIAPDSKCSFCGKSEYFVPTDPNGTTAALVTASVPHVKGLGVWMYMLVCPTCGHIAHINAHQVASKMFGDE